MIINIFNSISHHQAKIKEKKITEKNKINDKIKNMNNMNKIKSDLKSENDYINMNFNGIDLSNSDVIFTKNENENKKILHLLSNDFDAARTYATLVLTVSGLGLLFEKNRNNIINTDEYSNISDNDSVGKIIIYDAIAEASLRIENVLFANSKNNSQQGLADKIIKKNEILDQNIFFTNENVFPNSKILKLGNIRDLGPDVRNVRDLGLKMGNDNGDVLNAILQGLVGLYQYESTGCYSSSQSFSLFSLTSPLSSSSSSTSSSISTSTSSFSASVPPSLSSSLSPITSSLPSSTSSLPSFTSSLPSSTSSLPSSTSSLPSSTSSLPSSTSSLPPNYIRQLTLTAHRLVTQDHILPKITMQIISSLISMNIWQNVTISQLSDTIKHFLHHIDIIYEKDEILHLFSIIPYLTMTTSTTTVQNLENKTNENILNINFPLKLTSGITKRMRNEIQILTENLCVKILPISMEKENENRNENRNENESKFGNEKKKLKLDEKTEKSLTVDNFFKILKALKFSFFEISEIAGEFVIVKKISKEITNSLIYCFSYLINDFEITEIFSALNYFSEFGLQWNALNKNENESIENNNKNINSENLVDQSTIQKEILKLFFDSNLSKIQFENLKISLIKFGISEKEISLFVQKVPQEHSFSKNDAPFNNAFISTESSTLDQLTIIIENKNNITENPLIVKINEMQIENITAQKQNLQQTEKNKKKEIYCENSLTPLHVPRNVPRNVPKHVFFPIWKNLEELKEHFPLLYDSPNYTPNVLWSCYQEGLTVHTLLVHFID